LTPQRGSIARRYPGRREYPDEIVVVEFFLLVFWLFGLIANAVCFLASDLGTAPFVGLSCAAVALPFFAGIGLIRRRAWGWWISAVFFSVVLFFSAVGTVLALGHGSGGGIVAGLFGLVLSGFPFWLLLVARRKLPPAGNPGAPEVANETSDPEDP